MNEKKLYQIIIALLIATIFMLGFMIYGNYKIEQSIKDNYFINKAAVVECTTDYDCMIKND